MGQMFFKDFGSERSIAEPADEVKSVLENLGNAVNAAGDNELLIKSYSEKDPYYLCNACLSELPVVVTMVNDLFIKLELLNSLFIL